jgi:hypothetical protein
MSDLQSFLGRLVAALEDAGVPSNLSSGPASPSLGVVDMDTAELLVEQVRVPVWE